MDLRNAIFHDHPQLFFTVFVSALSFLALQPTASSIPIALTLTTLLVYGQRLFRSQYAFRDTAILTVAITIAGALAKASPSLNALSSPGVSIVVLSLLTLVTSSLTMLTVYIGIRLCSCFPGAWSQLTFFPALWTTLWFMVSSISPLGRLSAWSPTDGGDFYGWMLPLFGPMTNDWVVAAWAVVFSQAIGIWYIGGSQEEEDIPEINTTAPATTLTSHFYQKNSSLFLAVILLVLAIPSLLLSNFPLAVVAGPKITPLSVGCVLPQQRRYKHHTLTFDDYIEESKKLTNSAKVLLWPEGAATFNSELELAEGLAQVREAVTGSIVGVSFEEDFGDLSSGTPGSRRTGVALVSQGSSCPVLIYYKRHLVPIAESFSLSHSQAPPSIITMNLTAPNDMRRPDWAPGPSFTRPVPLTASICLDFAFPSLFADLESKPALILAPARTWDIAVGHVMWQQVMQRAEELGTMILWCDGGEGGVSGVAGGGFKDFVQVGPGSWVKNVGIPYPFNDRRTVNHRAGGDITLLFVWLLVLGTKMLDYVHFGALKRLGNVRKIRNFLQRPLGTEGNLVDL